MRHLNIATVRRADPHVPVTGRRVISVDQPHSMNCPDVACCKSDHDARRWFRTGADLWLHGGAARPPCVGWLPDRRSSHWPRDPRFRRRRTHCGTAGRYRRDAPDVRRRPALLDRRLAGRSQGGASGRGRRDAGGNLPGSGSGDPVGLDDGRGARLRTVALGREHGRAAEGAGESRPHRYRERTHRHRLARRRGRGDGHGAGPAAGGFAGPGRGRCARDARQHRRGPLSSRWPRWPASSPSC